MKTITRVISSAVMLLLTAVLAGLASKSQAFVLLWWPKFSQWLQGLLQTISGAVSFPLWEAIAALLLVWLIATLIHGIREKRIFRWLSGVVWCASLGIFLFMLLWGMGHFLPTKTEQILTVSDSSLEELQAATVFYGAGASQYAEKIQTDEEGKLLCASPADMNEEINKRFSAMAEVYSCIPENSYLVKKLAVGRLFSYMGVTGMYVPFTAESAYNPETYPSSVPYTMCHEAAHRAGACAEEDANFIAFLACVGSENPNFRYSGWYSAFIYCYNALYAQSPERAAAVWNSALSDRVKADLAASGDHYKAYEGAVQDAVQKVNDAYLKAFQEQGVQSYGLVSDALIAWYKSRKS